MLEFKFNCSLLGLVSKGHFAPIRCRQMRVEERKCGTESRPVAGEKGTWCTRAHGYLLAADRYGKDPKQHNRRWKWAEPISYSRGTFHLMGESQVKVFLGRDHKDIFFFRDVLD